MEIPPTIEDKPVVSIGDYAFYYCTGLTSLTIPDGVTSIGSSAFRDCTGLTSLTIPNSVTSIGNYAFRDCTGLTSLTIPNSVTSIGDYAFRDCTGLTSLTIPVDIQFTSSMFQGCAGLTSVTLTKGQTGTGTDYSYYDYNYIYKHTPWYQSRSNTISLTIEDGVTSIGNYAFCDCTGLTSLTIPDGVTSIGYSAFRECTGLTSLTIPNSVTSIGDCAFYGIKFYAEDAETELEHTVEDLSGYDFAGTYDRTIRIHTVIYNVAGGSVSAPVLLSLAKGDSFTIASYDGSKTGYIFGGWSDGTTTYAIGSTYTMGTSNIVLNAVWNIITYVDLPSLDVIGGVIAQSDKPVLQLTVNASDQVLDNSLFQSLGNKPFTLNIVDEGGKVQYSWTFYGVYKTEPGTFKAGISVIEPEGNLSDAISSTGMKNPLVLNFKANGKLPKDATLRSHVGDKYADGTELTLFFYNETTKQLEEKTKDLVVIDGYVTMSLTHCSSYVLAEHAPAAASESDNTTLYIGIGVAVVAILAIVAVAFLRRP